MNPKIKNIYIQVPFYDFSSKDSDIFIGRKSAGENLKRRLLPSKKKDVKYSGAYLVAGFRGMGKSKLVAETIEDIDSSMIKPLYISLSQNTVNDYDLLRQIFIEFNNFIEDSEEINWFETIFTTISKIILICLTFVTAFSLFYFKYIQQIEESNILVVLIFAIIFIQLGSLFKILKHIITYLFLKQKNKFENKRISINKRLFSSFEVSNNGSTKGFDGMGDGSPILDKVVSSIQDVFQDGKQLFDKLTAKELEIEIKELLRLYCNVEGAKKIIFIIDELDKIEPEYIEGNNEYLNLGKTRLETRKESVVSILASLKSFIHTSDAKFVFIGGAEMYDASLADVADRESFYSSIFNEVIYIDTFFKDQYDKNKVGLTEMVETYLSRVLLYNFSNASGLKDVISKFHIESKDDEWKYFITYLLYNFCVYLTYRSNGSPKKLKELIEYYLVEDFLISQGDDLVFVYTDDNKNCCFDKSHFLSEYDQDKYMWYSHKQQIKNNSLIKQVYLKINHRQLYKISLLTSIFKPYFINNQKYLKIRNDRNLYLTAFFMDHILKFHKSAFSWRELELIPDIIMGTKSPDTRESLISIVENLSIYHIRETSNAMFQFKFRSRTSMELKYISKISDESSAAYNFSLDESHHLKSFFKRKLKQKIELFKDNKAISQETSFIHSIADINATIADIHYYDDDYEPAIRYYADSIQALRDLVQQDKLLNPHQEMIYTRNRLLLALCLEKAFRYDSAYSVVRNIITDLKFINFTDRNHDQINYIASQSKESRTKIEWESPYKRMQMFLRPYLALLMIIEKERSDGITESNLSRNIQEYTNFLGLKDIFPTNSFNCKLTYQDFYEGNKKSDNKRIQTLLADYYQNVGSILFYKNRNFKSIYEEGAHGILNNYLKLIDFEYPINDQIKLMGGIKHKAKNYYFISNIKKCLDVKDHYFLPSYTSFFYYVTSFGHIVSPYIQNLNSIFQYYSKDQRIIDGKIFRILTCFENKHKTHHIINGKVKEQLGLILNKIADSILGSIHNAKLHETLFKEINHNFSFENLSRKLDWEIENDLKFSDLFSSKGFIYFTIQSFNFYKDAGKDYDALFQLKKLLYFIKSHRPYIVKNFHSFERHIIYVRSKKYPYLVRKNYFKKRFRSSKISYYHPDILNLAELIALQAFEILKNSELCICESKAFIYDQLESDFSKKADYLIESTDKTEINILLHTINPNIDSSIFPFPLDKKKLPQIKSIFLRILSLRFYVDHYINGTYYKSLQKLSSEFTDHTTTKNIIKKNFKEYIDINDSFLFCFLSLNEIINTYGFTYIMSHSYYASLLHKVLKCANTISANYNLIVNKLESFDSFYDIIEKDLVKKYITSLKNLNNRINQREIKKIAIINYQKAIRVHSEGKEYKSFIKNMYILDDDFNDTLVHFSAALERSLINNGKIERSLKGVEKIKVE